MAFEKLESIITGGGKGMPASIVVMGGGALPSLRIGLSKAFAGTAKIANGDKFDLLVGSGDERGVVRLVANTAGILKASEGAKGGFALYCGHVAQLGTDKRKKAYCAAELVDVDDRGPLTIEITLPPWALDQG
jgi:hypothetical protein